jgi:hypothetical protein
MLSDRAETPAVMAATGPEVSVRLTQAETDCIVGGQDGCLGVVVGSYKGCVESNFDPERPETATAFVECGAVGLWEGVLCAFSWLWDWLFA